ncbi:MAG TPA: hypothetical protein VL484_12925 [Vicinamibacterales bacterium]|jgi:hypothetical protein|nr:hypothetical protein [Vicinamibacterales bacterium]
MRTLLTIIALTLAVGQTDALRDALRLGRTGDQALYDAFNAGYQLAPSGPITKAEITTEFRRAVLIVRDRANQGEYGFTERDLEHAIVPYRGLVTIDVDASLSPFNTYIKAPGYDLYIQTGPRTAPLAPRNFQRTAIFAVPRPSPGTALTGVHLEAVFSVADIASASVPAIVVVDDKGDVLWTARLDLSRFR